MPSTPDAALREAVAMAEKGLHVNKEIALGLAAEAKGLSPSEAAEERRWERDLKTAVHAMRRLAGRGIPPGRSAERKAGDARELQLIKGRAAMLEAQAVRNGETVKTEAEIPTIH
jgi:hypothetical protein